MANRFWIMVNKVIDEANVLLLVLDARMVEETRNDEIEAKVKEAGKPLIYVLNKCDLVDKYVVEQYKSKIPNSVFISSKDHLGTTMLRTKIMIAAHRLGLVKVKVGVLGYPNVGKSSVINALKGKGSAKTSSMSGYTRHLKNIRTSKIMLIDTPGVIPYSDTSKTKGNKTESAHSKHAFIGTIDHTKEKNPDIIAAQLITHFPGVIEGHYGVPIAEDAEETIEAIAQKYNLKSKGNLPDVLRCSRMILKDWQIGKITQRRN